MSVTFLKVHTANRGTSTYKAEAEGLILYVPKSVSVHPDMLEVEGLAPQAAKSAMVRAKMTPEQKEARKIELKNASDARKAELKSMTPAQRAERKAEDARKRFEDAQAKAVAAAEKAAKK